MPYAAPLKDIRFVLEHIADINGIAALPGYEHASADVVEAVLTEAARLAAEVWAPTNRAGDLQGSKLSGENVKTPDGFKDAFTQYAQGGWSAFGADPAHGGQGLPIALGFAVNEMWQAGNLALSLCPMLTAAAVEAIEKHGTEEQKKLYMEKMIAGEWTGSMQMTEPQAGTDLAAVRTVAKKNGDHYLMKGQKIFITWGEHDFTPNIVHLILARIDGLPEGNDGLGLFIVPKFLVNPDGSLGKRNDARAVSLEHKLGIHGSPTCVMMYGENEGAVAYLVGEEGKGLRNMFTMMNNARLGVGVQGVGLAERAYQRALQYAKDRVQGPKMGDKSGAKVAIIEHADVRRMLLTMKASTEAARALSYAAGAVLDIANKSPDSAAQAAALVRADLLTPLVKAWATDLAVETASTALQVHGGMGFIEETGAAQHYRDARILPIYEGTNGIQANDLMFRKVLRDGGAEAQKFIDEVRAFIQTLAVEKGDDAEVISGALSAALGEIEESTAWIVANAKADMQAVATGAVPYLRQFSLLAGGYMMARLARAALQDMAAGGGDAGFCDAKIITARFFAEAILPQVAGLTPVIIGGCRAAVQMSNDQF